MFGGSFCSQAGIRCDLTTALLRVNVAAVVWKRCQHCSIAQLLCACCTCCAQRLVTFSEEVAYNDPPGGAAEKLILNQHLRRLVQYSGLSAFQRFIQQVWGMCGVCSESGRSV